MYKNKRGEKKLQKKKKGFRIEKEGRESVKEKCKWSQKRFGLYEEAF